MGMFVVEMSSDSFHLLGRSSSQRDPDMALFFLSPLEWCSSRWVSFQEIVAAENFLYCFGMIMEFAALLKLRFKHPAAERPYKIPFGTAGSVLMCVPPTVLLLTVVALASGKVMALGLVLETSLRYIEKRR
ncbi:hypothetical protein SAY86_031114 [Trapa natans]|uniref:Uncharacterized protein n=1 Tax=Trapa natans TaxID=22666 RepID=A0AAN7MTP4_TRANT|nr:hypothetical protein SAY86_031114 [Trapa natans]